jgi:hypothetical protein
MQAVDSLTVACLICRAPEGEPCVSVGIVDGCPEGRPLPGGACHEARYRLALEEAERIEAAKDRRWHSFRGPGERWAHVATFLDPPHWSINLYEGHAPAIHVAEARGLVERGRPPMGRLETLAVDWCAHGIAWGYPSAASLGMWRHGRTPSRGVMRFASRSSSIALRFAAERYLVTR